MRFRKIMSMIILHNSLSSAWSWLRSSSRAFCTAAWVPDLAYSAAVNSMILAGSCVPCSDKKKEYSRKRIIAGRLLLMTLCTIRKSLTNAKLESVCLAKFPCCLIYIFNIVHDDLNCNHSENILGVWVLWHAHVWSKWCHSSKHSAKKSMRILYRPGKTYRLQGVLMYILSMTENKMRGIWHTNWSSCQGHLSKMWKDAQATPNAVSNDDCNLWSYIS